MKIKHNYSGKSLLELRSEFGVGEGGFYNTTWWLKEKFATEKADIGIYDIEFHEDWNNLTYQEQLEKMGNGEEFLHPAVLSEAILTYHKKVDKNLMENWYSRTLCVVSDGDRVCVGYFGSLGLNVGSYWGDYRIGYIGVASARKFSGKLKFEKIDTFEPLKIDISEIVINDKRYKLVE